MVNPHLEQRLKGIQEILNGVTTAGSSLSSSTKGSEREAFIDEFLSRVLPPQIRFGQGDATDQAGNRSGQLDVVVEYPWIPSLPIVGTDKTRLYLAEGIAAVVEVKSNLANQWGEVHNTYDQLKLITRKYEGGLTAGWKPTNKIPLFAVGYIGWKNISTLESHMKECSLDGILVINPGLFVSSIEFNGISAEGPFALWGLITCIHKATSVLSTTAMGVPYNYAL